MLDLGGYDPKNIHLVWVLNKFEVALKQNDERERKVSINVMFKTHEGVSENLSNILKDLNSIRNIVDGDIWIVPNQTKVDNDAVVSLRKTFSGKEVKSVRYVKEYSAYQVKKSGKAPKSYDEICSDVIDNLHKSKIIDKIKDYVPVSTKDNW
jgi:malonyl CoA-acyl carrier protein transacylase